jgi:hypothetical protein
MNVERHYFFCVGDNDCVVFRLANTRSARRSHAMLERLITFALIYRSRGIRLGWTRAAPQCQAECWCLIFFALRADCVDSGWLRTRSATAGPHECWSVLIFCVEADCADIQAEHAQRRQAPHECWSASYFFALKADVDSGWAEHAQPGRTA